jgi:hypothetical protein
MVTVAVPLGVLVVADPVDVVAVLLELAAADPDGVGPASAPLHPANASAQAAAEASIPILR